MKQEDGKGFIKLIIGIVVIILVVLGGFYYVKEEIRKENVKNMQADLLLVQARVEITKGNYNMNKDEHPLKGNILTQLPEGIDINSFLEKNVIPQEEYEKYYLLDSRKFKSNWFRGIS